MQKLSRRELLNMSGASAGLLGVGSLFPYASAQVTGLATKPTAAGAYDIEIDGQLAVRCQSIDGGGPKVSRGPAGFALTHTPLKIRFNPADATPLFLDWLSESTAAGASARDVELCEVNSNGVSQARLRLSGARISSIVLPELEARNPAPFHVIVELTPAASGFLTQSKSKAAVAASGKSRQVLANSFALLIPKLDPRPLLVPSVDSLDLTHRPSGAALVSDLSFQIQSAATAPFHMWLQETQAGTVSELDGSLNLLSADFRNVLMRIDFAALVVSQILLPRSMSATTILATKITLTCRQARLNFDGLKS